MPTTQFISLKLNGKEVDFGALRNLGFKIKYTLETPEEFESKESSTAFGIQLPASPTNDKIFGSFHNPAMEDLTPGQQRRDHMQAEVYVNGSNMVLAGKALLESASHTDKPEAYTLNMWGGNGDWLLDMRNMTLWDCLSDHTHIFDVETIQDSWAFDGMDEANDYVYAPVRYRQPFGANDDAVTPYHLRPSLSIYWMLYRAFKAVGYRLESAFFDTSYFRRQVMPWTWGTFFDIETELLKVVGFKACGRLPESYPPSDAGTSNETTTNSTFTGSTVWTHYNTEDTSFFYMVANTGGSIGVGEHNVMSYLGLGANRFPDDSADGAVKYKWRMDNVNPPNGYNTLDNYAFDESTGVMSWTYNPPASLPYMSNNVTANFVFNVLHWQFAGSGSTCRLTLRVTKAGVATDHNIPVAGANPLAVPTVITFSVSGIGVGETITFQLIWVVLTLGSGGASLRLCQANYMADGSNWTPRYSSLELTGLQVELGGTVNLKWYDVFKKYRVLDMLGGVVDLYNLEPQTDNVNKVVRFEPMFASALTSTDSTPGYFQLDRVLDWTDKQDVSKANIMQLFSSHERQIDFTFKQDGADGGQNIWAARYKGVYLNGITGGKAQPAYMHNAAGIIAAVPGASRYVLPDRFTQGNRQKVNRFFSATMHCNMRQWKNITGIATQLIVIIPENINDTSASAVTQVFEPKIAYYKGLMASLATRVGGWVWQPDPNDSSSALSTAALPFMFSVNYSLDVSGNDGREDPVLSYSDQLINGNVVPGLMRRFYLQRMAIMRNGQIYKPWLNLTLRDMANPLHREVIFLRNAPYALIGIDDFNPLREDSSQCTMYKIVPPTEEDVNRCYPSQESVETSPALLAADDLRYAPLLLYPVDLPQV